MPKSTKPFLKPKVLADWKGPVLLLMDGTYFMFRAYHALPPLSTRTGVPTHAAYGFTTMLLKALREVSPTHVAVGFDLGGSESRLAIAPHYKANRTEPPEDLSSQFGLARRITHALEIPLLEERGVEADDVLGTLARLAEREGFFTVLLAGDKDFMQIVDDRTLLLDTMYERWVGADDVVAKIGVPPAQVVEYMALLGDQIDNVAGIPGVGPKTASQLIQQFGTVDALYAHLNGLPETPGNEGARGTTVSGNPIKDKLQAKLREHEPSVRLARKLVELDLNRPLPVSLSDLERKTPAPAPLRSLFEELEFTRLVRELPAPDQAASAAAPLEKPALSFAAPELWGSQAAPDALAWFAGRRPLAVHVELAGAGDRPNELVGVALAAAGPNGVRAGYVPLTHDSFGGMVDAASRARLAALLADAEVPKVGFGLKRAATALRAAGLTLTGLSFDSELALYLIDPGRREHALGDVISQRFTAALPPVPETTARKKLPVSAFMAETVAPRAAASAQAALALEPLLAGELRALGLWTLYEELELPLLSVLAGMEETGVALDLGLIGELAKETGSQIAALEARIHEMAGHAFNIASNQQLCEVLFQELKLPILRRTKTGPSTDQDVLEKLAQEHPLPAAVLELRQLAKLKGTYLDALPLLVDPRDRRVHTTFNQATAATGRLSSSDPNLQNIPTRTELGKRIRRAFIAAPGNVLISADYNQVELRILAHMTEDAVLREQFARELDIHTQTAAEVFGVSPADVTPVMRNAAKAINFGIAYGLSAFGLSQRLELPTGEAQAIIDRYFERYRGVRDWLDATIEAARKEGSVSTLFGRRRLLPDILSKNRMVRQGAERMAVNTPIQGTAADLIKRAMLRADRALREVDLGARMTLQVHDELVFEAPEEKAPAVAELAREAMSGAGQLAVPLVVTVGINRCWAEAH